MSACPSCHRENPPHLSFCRCGAQLKRINVDSVVRAVDPAPVHSDIDVNPYDPGAEPAYLSSAHEYGSDPEPLSPPASVSEHITSNVVPLPKVASGVAPASGARPRQSLGPAHLQGTRLAGWLVTFEQDPDGQDHRINEGQNYLGSSPECQIVLAHPSVLPFHACIVCRNGKMILRNEESEDGTLVNGENIELESRRITGTERIRIGDVEVRIVPLPA